MSFALAALLVLLGLVEAQGHQSPAARPPTSSTVAAPVGPDVLVIVWDDVGSPDLELYGGPVATPHLSALAAVGVVFERAYANGMCMPSRRSLMTGRWSTSRSGEHCEPASPLTPAFADVFLPETAPAHTALLFGKWHLGAHQGGKAWQLAPSSQGWDVWLTGHGGNVGSCDEGSYAAWNRVEATGSSFSSSPFYGYEPKAVRDAFLSAWPATRSPKLAWVAGQLAHAPFHVPPPDLLSSGSGAPSDPRARFELMVAASDHTLGEMLAVVDLARTLVVVLGDNGTPGQVAPDPDRAKFSSYERGVRVPLVIAGKGVSGGRRVTDLVHLVDVFATAAEAMGGSPWAVDGVPLGPILRDEAHPPPHQSVLVGHNWASAGEPGNRAVVRLDGLKLVQRDFGGDGLADAEELFALSVDPLELAPLPLSGVDYEALEADLNALAGGH